MTNTKLNHKVLYNLLNRLESLSEMELLEYHKLRKLINKDKEAIYYSMVANYIPFLCTPITYSFVTKKSPQKILDLHIDLDTGSDMVLLNVSTISKEEYEIRLLTNPKKDTYMSLGKEHSKN